MTHRHSDIETNRQIFRFTDDKLTPLHNFLQSHISIKKTPYGSNGQGKLGKNLKKSGNFTFRSHGKIWESGKVRKNQSSRVQKLTKMQKKLWTVLRRLRTTVHKFFSARFARRLFVSTLLNLFHHLCFWCDCKRLNTIIGILHEQISQGKQFILSWNVRENEFCRVVGTMTPHLVRQWGLADLVHFCWS